MYDHGPIRARTPPLLNQVKSSLKLTKPGFPYNLLPVSCGDIGFKKILGLGLAWKSGLKVPLLSSVPSFPLQTILPSDLVGCDSPLPILIAIGVLFILFEGR